MTVTLASPFLKEAGHLDREPQWSDSAICTRTDPAIFFPEEDTGSGWPEQRFSLSWPAKLVCADCPVKRDCLLEALGRRDPYGVWGGLDWIERRALGPDPSGEAIDEALSHVGMKTCRCGTEERADIGFTRKNGSYSSLCRDCQALDHQKRKVAA